MNFSSLNHAICPTSLILFNSNNLIDYGLITLLFSILLFLPLSNPIALLSALFSGTLNLFSSLMQKTKFYTHLKMGKILNMYFLFM